MRLFSMLVFSAVLSGCASFSEPIVTTETVYVKQDIPATLMTATPLPPPPDRTEYMSYDCIGRETMLTNYTAQLMVLVVQSNNKLTSIRKLVTQ